MGADTLSCFPFPYPDEVIKVNTNKQGVKIYFKDNFIIIFSLSLVSLLSEFQLDAMTGVLDVFGHPVRYEFDLELPFYRLL